MLDIEVDEPDLTSCEEYC